MSVVLKNKSIYRLEALASRLIIGMASRLMVKLLVVVVFVV